jgi:hypothetical protein
MVDEVAFVRTNNSFNISMIDSCRFSIMWSTIHDPQFFSSLSSPHFQMFSLFGDPFVYRRPVYRYGYRPAYDPFAYARATDIFDRYLDAFERRLFADLDTNEQTPEALTSPQAPASLQSSESAQAAKPAESTEAAKPTEASEAAKPAEAPTPTRQVAREPVPTKQFIYQTKSTFDGQNYIEEHRERVTGHDGEIRTVVRRRLGDRWYESETHRDKDGKETERETWHNIADDEIDGFKEEWSLKHQKPSPAPQPAIESPNAAPKPTTD